MFWFVTIALKSIICAMTGVAIWDFICCWKDGNFSEINDRGIML